MSTPSSEGNDAEKVSGQVERWLGDGDDQTVGGLLDLFGQKRFALLFIILLGVSAVPLPTGGPTHVFDVIAVLVAAQLVIGRDRIWLPARWCRTRLAGSKQ